MRTTIIESRTRIICAAAVLILMSGCTCPPRDAAPVAEPAPAAKAAPVTTTEDFAIDAAQLFDFDKATLRPEAAEALRAAVEKYRGNAKLVSLEIIGHTDNVGTDTYNQDLSLRRANAVRDYLVEQGVDAARMTASGRGESAPAASNDTAEGRQQNRRVELKAAMQREVTH